MNQGESVPDGKQQVQRSSGERGVMVWKHRRVSRVVRVQNNGNVAQRCPGFRQGWVPDC